MASHLFLLRLILINIFLNILYYYNSENARKVSSKMKSKTKIELTIILTLVAHQENVAYTKMQKVVDEHGYNAIDLEPVKARTKLFTIYEYKSSFSNQKTLNKNKKLFRKVGYKIDKHDNLETPYRYSISAVKSNWKWTVYIREEPFGKEKSYHVN